MGMPYKVGTVANDIQDYRYPFTWVFYLTVIILAALITLTLYATFANSKQKLLKSLALS